MSHYELGKEYFLKAKVADIGHDGQYPLRVMVPVVNSPLKSEYTSIYIANEPGILLTVSEVAAELVEDTNAQIALYKDEIKKLRSENDSLKDAVEVLKEQKKGLEKTIDKHETTIEERTIECNRWEGMYDKASKRCDELRKKNDELTAWYEEANKTASEAAEANDELKANVAKLKAYLEQRDKDFWAMKKDRDELDSIGGKLRAENEELRVKLAEFKEANGKQTAEILGLKARLAQFTDANETAAHMASIHNLQVAVEVLAEKIFEMRCEQDG